MRTAVAQYVQRCSKQHKASTHSLAATSGVVAPVTGADTNLEGDYYGLCGGFAQVEGI